MSSVPWQKLLTELGLQPVGITLPCVSRCPGCCEISLTTYHDTACNSLWHHCSSCKFAGDTAEVAASAWSVDTDVAEGRLAEAGLSVNKLTETKANLLKSLKDVWCNAGSLLDASSHLRSAVGAHDAVAALWSVRGNSLVRMANYDDLLAAGLPVKMLKKADREIAVIPLYDLPGRISAMLFTACDGTVKVSAAVAALDCMATSVDAILDAEGPLIVTNSHARATYWQLKNFASASDLLPITSCESIKQLPDSIRLAAKRRKTVLWVDKLDSQTAAIAVALNAAISVDFAAESRDSSWLSRFGGNPRTMINDVIDSAEPWRQVMQQELMKLSPTDATSLLRSLQLSREDELAVVDSQLQRRLGELGSPCSFRTISLSATRINEGPEGWTVAATGEIVSDVVVRIDKVLTRTATGKIWYSGRLLYKNEEIAFSFEGREAERNLLRAARQRLLEMGKGLSIFKESWQSRAFEMSLLFHSPTEIDAVSGCGWDHDRQRFVFPGFVIEEGGSVKRFNSPVLAGESPLGMDEPMRLARDETQTVMSANHQHPLWPVVITVLYNAMASIYKQPGKGLLISSKDASTVAAIAAAAGCQAVESSPSANTGNWPFVSIGTWRASKRTILESQLPAIVESDDTASLVAYTNGGWFMLRSQSVAVVDTHILRLVNRLVPDFIHYLLCDRRLTGLWTSDLETRCIDRLADYLVDRGADAAAASAAVRRAVICRSGYAASCFGKVIARLYLDGAVKLIDGGSTNWLTLVDDRGRRKACVKTCKDAGTVWVPQAAINSVLYSRGLPRFDVTAVTARLKDTGHLVEELDIEEGRCWVVKSDWMNRQLKRHVPDSRIAVRLAK